MSAKKFTILVIPEGSHHVRRYILNPRLLKGVLALVVLVGCGFGLVTADYLRIRQNDAELRRLQGENRLQRQELREVVAQIEALRREMVVLAQNDAKVRVMAELTAPQGDVLSGVGGPPEDDSQASIVDLQLEIDRIREAIDLRRQSQEEIEGLLNDQRSLAGAKPQGMPAKGWITSNFGMRNSPFSGRRKMHEGLDVAARTGTPIVATADGIVSRAETAPGYGKLVVVDHGYGYRTYYAHNSKLFVKVGQRVKRGEQIAAVGSTGSSTGPHVHYEVRVNNVPVNPRKFL